MRRAIVGVCLLGVALAACAEVAVEYRYLDGPSCPERWSTAECQATVSAHKVWEHPAIRMQIPVDFNAGEKLYPIGWPRMYLSLQPNELDWQNYDRFEFQLLTETSRTNLPKRPLIFHLYDAQGQNKLYTLDLATIGVWKTFSINISDLGFSGTVTRLGFNINESDYYDKDLINFHFGGFRLARFTIAQVTELKAVTPVLFRDSRVLPVELVVVGTPEKLVAGIPVQLRRGDRIAFTNIVPVTRGRQTIYIPLTGEKLEPGIYAFIVNPETASLRKEVPFTIVSSPYGSADIPSRD